ncbi:prop effector [Caenimonas sedimenti]|uniref:Prop effector n=1 Tax=Caenimonas sedimenti TaxID=2596921 RepID=A0A562ZRA7_9BURK|nr:ProQ/FINO family protein [Caenimonas sedimenti]TWO70886.1 prop effector [Caenimonas sedimenti]
MTATETDNSSVIAPPAPAAPRKRPQPRTPHPLLERLFQHYPKLFGARFLPLKRGIYHDLAGLHPDFAAEELKLALSQHTRSTRYLEAVADIRQRHDLQGAPVEDVAPEHVYQAIMEIHRRRQTRGHAGTAAWLQERLVAAIEAAGLDRAAYEAQVRAHDPAAVAALDEAFAAVAERSARREALVRAFQASGRSVEEFADMYGMQPADVRRAVETAKPAAATI